MPETFNLTGCWVGHYVQHDQEHGIAADLVHEGAQLSGTMRDRQTEFERSVFEVAVEAGLPPGADEQIVEKLRQSVPGSGHRPIRCVSQLPPHALLEGLVTGRTIYWLKTYQGTAFGGYRVGDERVGVEVANPEVHYRGEVRADGTAIEGAWWIDPQPEYGTRRQEGLFTLRRLPAESAASTANEAVTARARPRT